MTAYLELARRGRTDWWRYVLTWIAAPLLWIAAVVVIYIPVLILRVLPADFGARALNPAQPLYFYGFAGFIFGLLLVAFAITIRLIHGKRFSDIVGRWNWRQFATGAGLWLVLCGVGAAVDYWVRPAGFRLTLGAQTVGLALIAIPSLAVQTFCEEFVFRGYVTQGLALWLKRPIPAASLSGAFFAVWHIPNGVPEAVNALVFGTITALIVMRTTNLAFTYGIHLVNNLFGAVVVVSAGDVLHGSPGVFTQATPDLMWLDVAASAIAFVLAWLWVSRTRPASAVERAEATF